MIHTHPQYLEFVGEQIAKKREKIKWIEDNDPITGGAFDEQPDRQYGQELQELETDLSAWLAIHDGLCRHEQLGVVCEWCTCREHDCGVSYPCRPLLDITKHLDKVMEK